MGRVEAIHVTTEAGAPMHPLESAEALPGRGLAGDRYALGTGYYSVRPLPGGARELTLFEAETLDVLRERHGIEFAPHEHRRNLTTRGVRLRELIGRRFHIGEVLCVGVRDCPPCVHLVDVTGKPVLEPLVDLGGLRAGILQGGVIRVGDPIVVEAAEAISSTRPGA